ncbi:peptidase S8/S53 domain-containing protein [Dichotomocladium elegans]|nr:peptidase S8/S53 domain-containing protein [Dichotomocladium elegans]
MKTSTVFTALVSFAIATGALANSSATHVIKFKDNYSKGMAPAYLVSRHREYMRATLRDQMQATYVSRRSNSSADNQGDDADFAYAASAMEQQISLDSISIDENFVGVLGDFSKHPEFLELLHQDKVAIEYIEPNYAYRSTLQIPYLKERTNIQTAPSPDWGLARITQHDRIDLNSYHYNETAGAGIDVFIMDSGVHVDHNDFEGRAVASANFVEHEDAKDLGGHGTHVAGKVAGKRYGVAKGASIHSVKILNKTGDGTLSNLIKGIAHVVSVAKPGKAIINLSLSGPESRFINEAISKLVNTYNIPVFVSAGNSAMDACFYSPSSNPDAFVVGATDIYDHVAPYSNTGSCVNIYAPGSNISSSWIGGSDEVKSLDGTSMANPHVAGIAAVLMSRQTFATARDVYNAISALATRNVVDFGYIDESNANLLAYVDFS